MKITMTKSYSELVKMETLEERFAYLKLGGKIGQETFGINRWLNQKFYASREWREFRAAMIVRDKGNCLALPDYPISGLISLHHINPITLQDIEDGGERLFDPENVICVSDIVHKAIHYGDFSLVPKNPVERVPGDTKLW